MIAEFFEKSGHLLLMEKKMKKETNWIRITTLILVAIGLVSVVSPFLLDCILNVKNIKPEWTAGDILSYIGAVLFALGATVLGLVAMVVEKKNEDKNHILQWHPQVDIVKVDVESCIRMGDIPKDMLVLKKESANDCLDLRYRIFNITCHNNYGLAPDCVKISNAPIHSVYYNNGHRRGTSLVTYSSPLNSNKEFRYENCKNLIPETSEYIKICSLHDMNFTFSLAIAYLDNDNEFVEDTNPSIAKKEYGLNIPLRFKNSLGLFEEGVFTILSAGEDIIFNKSRIYFNKEK